MIFFTNSSTLKTSNADKQFLTQVVRRKTTHRKITFINIAVALLLVTSTVTYGGTISVPDMPGAVSGQKNVCAYVGTAQPVTYTIDAVAGAELYLWTVPTTVNIVSGQGTRTLVVTFLSGFTAAANKQIKVRAISEDGNSADRILYLLAQQPVTPNVVNGPSNACIFIGTPNAATYTTARDVNATSYIWAAPAGTTISHPNRSGVNDTIIQVIFKSDYKTGQISVQAANNCGFSTARSLTVAGSAPSTPGAITGPTNACSYMLPNGTAANYSINAVTGASAYTWTAPPGSIITHPNGAGIADINVTIQYPPDFTGGSISVVANSGCDESAARYLAIGKLNPSTPGAITPLQKVICPNREYSYTLPSMPANATTVNWTVPAEAIGFSGQGTASITVLYPESHVNGNVSATAVSNCASSASRTAVVALGRCQLERSSGINNIAGRGTAQANTSKPQTITTVSGKPGVSIAPNPSRGNFKLQVITEDKSPINAKLLDLQGRELKKMNLVSGQSQTFGDDLKAGTYLLEIEQGNNKRTEKLMKL